jgi:hypothetical protein
VRLGDAIASVHGEQRHLADELRRVADVHAVEHDVYHTCHTLALLVDAAVETLAPFAERYGEPVRDGGPVEVWQSLVSRVRRVGSEAAGRSTKPGSLLLDDLRGLFLGAQECALGWVVLRQGGSAARDADLLAACDSGAPVAERVAKWARTRIKEAAPQVLVGG